jgi:putative transposase
MKWAARHRIDVQHIEPGKPIQNAFCESFNGRFRDECLNVEWFASLNEARRHIASWRSQYNAERPHSAVGNQTSNEFEQAWRAAA